MRMGLWIGLVMTALGVSGCVYVPPSPYGPGYYAPVAVAPAPVYVMPRPHYYYRPRYYYRY